jgi:hypothetical protein
MGGGYDCVGAEMFRHEGGPYPTKGIFGAEIGGGEVFLRWQPLVGANAPTARRERLLARDVTALVDGVASEPSSRGCGRISDLKIAATAARFGVVTASGEWLLEAGGGGGAKAQWGLPPAHKF